MAKNKLIVKDVAIRINKTEKEDYISLTDIAKYKSDEPAEVVKNWLRNKNTIEFLGLWEKLNNENFNPVEFDQFKNAAGSNVEELVILSNLESFNAQMIKQSLNKEIRFLQLKQIAKEQFISLLNKQINAKEIK